MTDSVLVAVRSRPLSNNEREKGAKDIIEVSDNGTLTLIADERNSPSTYNFDFVYGPSSGQADVYRDIGDPLIKRIMDGYNCTLFAYGQTGSGKTHTMMGSDTSEAFEDAAKNGIGAGIIPRLTADLLRRTNALVTENDDAGESKVDVHVTLSYLEIYMEEIHDLLNPGKGKLEIRESPDEIYVDKLCTLVIKENEEVGRLVQQGNAIRKVASTDMNERSSRSHSVLTVQVQQRKKELLPDGVTTRQSTLSAKLNLVDLAGSERVGKTGASGQTLKEAGVINKSLMQLGTVITALAKENKKGSIGPSYRESKLTRLLQESLGGNARTVMLAAVSPADKNRDETESTLRYAKRAKLIQNKVVKNEDVMDRVVRELQEEINNLKRQLEANSTEQVAVDSSVLETNRAELERKLEEMRIEEEKKWEERIQEREILTAELERERQANIGRALGDIIGDVVQRKKEVQSQIRDLQRNKAVATKKLRNAETKIVTGKKELQIEMAEYQVMQKERDDAMAKGDAAGVEKSEKRMKEALYMLNLKGDETKAFQEAIFRYRAEVEECTAAVEAAKAERDASATMLQENDRIRFMIQEEERKKWEAANKGLLDERLREERELAASAKSAAEKETFESQKELRRLKGELAEAKSNNEFLRNQIDRLESAEAIAKLESEALETEREDHLEHIKTLQLEIKTLNSHIAESEVEIERVREPLDEQIKELTKQLKEAQEASENRNQESGDPTTGKNSAENSKTQDAREESIETNLLEDLQSIEVSPKLHEAAKKKLAQITDHFGRSEQELNENFRQLKEVQSSRLEERLRKKRERKQAMLGAKASKDEKEKLEASLRVQEEEAQKELDDQLRMEQLQRLEAQKLEQQRHEEDVLLVLREHENSKNQLEKSLEAQGKEGRKKLEERLRLKREQAKRRKSRDDTAGERVTGEEVAEVEPQSMSSTNDASNSIEAVAEEIAADEIDVMSELKSEIVSARESSYDTSPELTGIENTEDGDAQNLLDQVNASSAPTKVQVAAREKLADITKHFNEEELALRNVIEENRKSQSSKLQQRLNRKRERKMASATWSQASEDERARLEAEMAAAEKAQMDKLKERIEAETAKKLEVHRLELQRHREEVLRTLKDAEDGEAPHESIDDLKAQQVLTAGSSKAALRIQLALKAIAASNRKQDSSPASFDVEEHGFHIFKQMVEILEQDRSEMESQLAQTQHLLRQATADLLHYAQKSTILEGSMSTHAKQAVATDLLKLKENHEHAIADFAREEQKRKAEIAAAKRQMKLSATTGSSASDGMGIATNKGNTGGKSLRSRVMYLMNTSRALRIAEPDVHPEEEHEVAASLHTKG